MKRNTKDIHCVVDDAPQSSHWRPAPWSYLGDEFCAYTAIVLITIAAPLMVALIGSAEIVWYGWLKLKTIISFKPVSEFVHSIADNIAKRILKDPRNASYLPSMLWLGVWTPMIFMWALHRYINYGLEWWVVFLYHFMRIGPRFRFFAYYHVLVHKEGHDHSGFFLPPFSFLNHTFFQWYLAIFFGQIPNSYAVGHQKIHHRYNNKLDDVHTCYDLDRTDPWSFLVYLPRFAAYWTGFSVFGFFLVRKEYKLAGRMLAGMCYYATIISVVCWYAWDFGVCILLFPCFESIAFLGAISYIWHAFLDANNPDSEYINSLTILNGKDNIFNEDYHVVHHHPNPNIHWQDYPSHYEEHIEEYKKNQATIFNDCEEGELLHWLFTKQWDVLAEHFVDLNGKMTQEDKKALILRRLNTTLSEVNHVSLKSKVQ